MTSAEARYKEKLKEQIEFIKTSSLAYDNGQITEAIRIATHLRTIFHDTKSSTSLLTHLGIKDQIHILSTKNSNISQEELLAYGSSLYVLEAEVEFQTRKVTPKYLPVLENFIESKLLKVQEYLEEPLYLIDNIYISRKDLILWITNKDGGAHVDSTENFSPTFLRIINHGFFKYEIIEETPPYYTASIIWNALGDPPESDNIIPILNGHLADIRQIAFEILNSPDLSEYKS